MQAESGAPLYPVVPDQRRYPAGSCRQSETHGSRDRVPEHPAHLGSKLAVEPSLMMPGITISFIFSEQGGLYFRAFPS